MTNQKQSESQRGGSGNFVNNPDKAREAGKKGGEHSHGGSQHQGSGAQQGGDRGNAGDAGKMGGSRPHNDK